MNKRLLMAVSLAFAQMVCAQATKHFFVMISPDFEEWMSAVPMISMDGGMTGKAMTAVDDMCGWFSYAFTGEELTDNVVLYRDDDTEREDVIGVNGNWETAATAQPIALKMLFNMGVDSLFFVPDEDQKTNGDGYYYSKAEVDGIEGTCSYVLASIIYDTDASLHPAFSCYSASGKDCQQGALDVKAVAAQEAAYACFGVTQGLVYSTLDATVPQSQRKPKLSASGKKCFIDEKYFNMLFNYTPGVNEKSCFDMPFKRAKDGKWEFDSDYYTSPGTSAQGGFYPVETTTDATILAADPTQTPLKAARTKRTADGPVFYSSALRAEDPIEGVPVIDILCNGPGWNGGMDCEGLFADGESTTEPISSFLGLSAYACIFGWSCPQDPPEGWAFYNGEPRWTSKVNDDGTGGRNQHYCLESHAKFVYKPGLKFSFRSEGGDAWVFVDNKLAVDLGGVHLSAPGYVDLDNFKGLSGSFVAGNQYDLDIFYCDRRTTMAGLRIKTNAYISRKTAISVKGKKNPTNPAETSYEICYTATGDGSCASALTGSDEGKTYCGSELLEAGVIPSYTLVNGNNITENVVPDFEDVSTSGVYKCGINLTNPATPKVDMDKLCLGGGRYTLFVTIGGKSKKVAAFRMSSDVDVVFANGVAKDTNGVALKDGKYIVEISAVAGEMIPIYISNVASDADSKDVEILPQEAIGAEYTLSFDKLMKVYRKSVDSKGKETFQKISSGEMLTIGESGIDTLYATVDKEDMSDSVQSFEVSVMGRPNSLKLIFALSEELIEDKIPVKRNIDFAAHSFRVSMTGPLQFTIVMNESVASIKKNFAVMDLQGRIVQQGVINSTETTVPVLSSGTYVVKVGQELQRINVR
ncbi:fibro-slime domain-containing protein [Fibrobacter succinogenes]|uniref:fibro-slime domain-containing protein n=1 Tax=Fibrobacter succinogenes TaxID=833 RepID=UPI0013D6D577|nr:fibro-slime domain-containing protein [Fibrobacter succinogenes]